MVDEKSDISQQYALATRKVNHFLSCIKRRAANRLREVTILLHSNGIPPGILHPALGLPMQTKTVISYSNPEEGHKKDQSARTPLLSRKAEVV